LWPEWAAIAVGIGWSRCGGISDGRFAQSAQYDRWIQFNLTDESGFKVTAPRPSLHLE
jgi:hypothetical protein